MSIIEIIKEAIKEAYPEKKVFVPYRERPINNMRNAFKKANYDNHIYQRR